MGDRAAALLAAALVLPILCLLIYFSFRNLLGAVRNLKAAATKPEVGARHQAYIQRWREQESGQAAAGQRLQASVRPEPVAPAARSGAEVLATSSPPPTGKEQAALRRVRDQAILFRRHVPPRAQALSYWGGVPLAPAGFDWPAFALPDGSTRALHFVMQIDCAAIPERGRLGLAPDRGILYVFLDLDWGSHWRWSVMHFEGEPSALVPAAVPPALPKAYAQRSYWGWPRTDEDWPRLLPRWSFDPVLVEAEDSPASVGDDEDDDRDYFPGAIRLVEALEKVDGAVLRSRYYENKYDEGRALVRPFANYPHDWQAVRIATGQLQRQLKVKHLSRAVKRGDMSQDEADAKERALSEVMERWTSRAKGRADFEPLGREDSDAAWRELFLDPQPIALFALSEAVNQSLDATLSGSPAPAATLPSEALDLVRSRHALASRGETGVHVGNTDHMLGAPSYVQGDAEERIGEWLLLLELSSADPIGHHFGEGVYQFWIRPADLAARRFDRVELTASAY